MQFYAHFHVTSEAGHRNLLHCHCVVYLPAPPPGLAASETEREWGSGRRDETVMIPRGRPHSTWRFPEEIGRHGRGPGGGMSGDGGEPRC